MTLGRKQPTPAPLDQVKPDPPPAPPPPAPLRLQLADDEGPPRCTSTVATGTMPPEERRSGRDRRMFQPLPDYVANVNEGQRQILLLALAKLSIERPGWLMTIGEISDQFGGNGRELLEAFRKIEGGEHGGTDGTESNRTPDRSRGMGGVREEDPGADQRP